MLWGKLLPRMHEWFSDTHGLIRAFVANKRHTQFIYVNLMLWGELLPRMHEWFSDTHGLIRAFVATPSAQTHPPIKRNGKYYQNTPSQVKYPHILHPWSDACACFRSVLRSGIGILVLLPSPRAMEHLR